MFPKGKTMTLENTKNAGWKYLAVSEADPNLLSKRVADLLNQGWELAGNISTVYHPIENQIWFTQAVMKLDPWNDNNN